MIAPSHILSYLLHYIKTHGSSMYQLRSLTHLKAHSRERCSDNNQLNVWRLHRLLQQRSIWKILDRPIDNDFHGTLRLCWWYATNCRLEYQQHSSPDQVNANFDWFTFRRLQPNPSKSEVIWSKTSANHLKKMNGIELNLQVDAYASVRYLGVELGSETTHH